MRRVLRPMLLLLAGLLVVPGPVTASEDKTAELYTAELYIDECRKGSGGAYGKGYIQVRVRADELGRSQTRRFTIRITWERLRPIGWPDWADNAQVVDYLYRQSGSFANDAADHYFTAGATFDFDRTADWRQWGNRIEVLVKFEGKRLLGGWYVVRSISERTINCTGASPAGLPGDGPMRAPAARSRTTYAPF